MENKNEEDNQSTVKLWYRGGKLYWWRKPVVPRENHRPVASHWQTLSYNSCMEYTSTWAGFKLTTLVVIRTVCKLPYPLLLLNDALSKFENHFFCFWIFFNYFTTVLDWVSTYLGVVFLWYLIWFSYYLETSKRVIVFYCLKRSGIG
jgi:hypothetical protein